MSDMTSAVASSQHLRAGGVSLLVASEHPGAMPRILHWGADLGDLTDDQVTDVWRASRPVVSHSAYDSVRPLGIVPQPADGFAGRPVLDGFRIARSDVVTPDFAGWTLVRQESGSLQWESADASGGVRLTTELELTDSGVARMRHTLTNDERGDFAIGALRVALPLAAPATELLDLTGRWCRERSPQRRPLQQGSWVRESRRGRTGHDATLLLLAGTPGFGFGHGEVWAVHVAWSGDHTTYAERMPEGDAHLGGGELLGAGEVLLGDGESYATPWLYAAWSDAGIDGVGDRMHSLLRSRPSHPRTPRPVVLNTWEAVYFEQDLDTLLRLADAAAGIGVERFVLDDGWFRGRRDDRSGLGDWTVDAVRWPGGLHPLVDHVRSLGMDFGLWVEPEMVNLDSDLARAHPDWILRGREELPATWRHQQVVDLQNPAVFAHLRDALLALLDEYPIAYLKWDHNRDLTDVAHDGRPAVHGQTQALYALLDSLRAVHPEVEIESCASGGGRVDLEVLERTDRIWTSDCNDALERQSIQRWTQLLVPPELMGAHVGAPVAHTTGRRHGLAFRAVTALFGHFGIEWDLTSLSDAERAELARWIAFYKQMRPLLHTGRVVRSDHPDPGLWVHGVVSQDRDDALYALVSVASSQTTVPLPVRLPGLDPERIYRVEVCDVVDRPPGAYHAVSGLEEDAVVLPGRVLSAAGVTIPIVLPETARLLRVSAVS
jgi:alpha-galactosidase